VEHVLFAAWLAASAIAFAKLEIQIEGEAGWARNLPTWRVDNRWTRALLGGRELTGYHLWCHVFVLVMAHAALLNGNDWTWRHEARVVAFIILFWILEDFLWFVFNPRFGIAAFTAERVWWHRGAWWLVMPREYWIGIPAGIGAYAYSIGCC